MGLKMKLNIVNKHEYEEKEDYKEIVIRIPKEELKEDFEYLGLDYNNLSIQDIHILECVVIDADDPEISSKLTSEITSIINKANQNRYTTTYQDIKRMFTIINRLEHEDREKLLAVLEFKRYDISNMNDALKYANKLDDFTLYSEVECPEDYARRLIEDGEISIEDIMEYIDFFTLGQDYCYQNKGRQTDHGLIIEKMWCDKQLAGCKEYEEEFE